MSDEARKQVAAIQANAHTFKKPSPGMETNNNPRALSSIDDTFTRLKAICVVGNAFKTPTEEAIVKQEWMLAMREEGVVKQYMIDDGIEYFRVKSRKTRAVTFFPTIGEFIDACVGSDDKLERAMIAYRIFSNPTWDEKQVCSIGVLVVSRHGFDLKAMKSSDGKKRFIELYLEIASNNEFKLLDAYAITETVQLSKEQRKDADKRTQHAENSFLAKFSNLIDDEPEKEVKTVKSGVNKGKIKVGLSHAQKLAEIERQLNMINDSKIKAQLNLK